MRFLLAAFLLATPLSAATIDYHAEPTDMSIRQVRMLVHGSTQIERFFDGKFTRPIEFTLAPNRAAFDAALPASLGMGKSECWMVGMGIGDAMILLSPADWKAEACEHNPADTTEMQRLVTHELTHVYHGQHNPHPDFTGEDDLGWWIEGLAVLVSGQLTPERVTQVRAAIAAGTAPTRLADVWSGKLRYGFAGSLAAYVDKRWGRATTRALLGATSNAEALKILGTTETGLLADWKRSAG